MMDRLPPLEFDPCRTGPLDGVRVLDLSRLVAGNMATHVLADFGADVIKVEAPEGGDTLRRWEVDGVATYWQVYARNKRSLALDLAGEDGRSVLLRLVGQAQILVESFVPGKLEAMGLGPERLMAANERLVVLRISGYGQTGPSRGKPGFGTLVEAACGFAAQNGFADRPPVLPPIPLSDMLAGLYGVGAVLIALRAAERDGRGQVVDLSLMEAMLGAMGPQAADYAVTGAVKRRQGSRVATTAPRNTYVCGDGVAIALSAATPSMFDRLVGALDLPGLREDPRFADNAGRVRHVEALDAAIEGRLARETARAAVARLDAAGVPAAVVDDVAGLIADAQVRDRASLVRVPDRQAGALPMHNVTPRLSGTPGALRRPAPLLGEHSEEILAELGAAVPGG